MTTKGQGTVHLSWGPYSISAVKPIYNQITFCIQAHRIRFEFRKAAADNTYMRIDGEPWKQPLPVDDDTVVVEISHLGQVKMLANQDCKSKSISHLSSHSSTNHIVDDDDDYNEEYNADSEERRKFGAADTFRIPDDVDVMARLS